MLKIFSLFCKRETILQKVKDGKLHIKNIMKCRLDEEICISLIKNCDMEYIHDIIKRLPERLCDDAVYYAIIAKDPYLVRYLRHPSENVITVAMRANPRVYRILDDDLKTEKIDILAVTHDPYLIMDIPDPSVEVCQTAVEMNASMIKHVPEQNYTMCEHALKVDGMLLKYVKIIDIPLREIALMQNGLAVQFISAKDQTEKLCIIAIEQNPKAIQYIQNPTYAVCMSALAQDPTLVQYMYENDKAYLLYDYVVGQDGMNLQYVPGDAQTDSLCIKAVKDNGLALKFVHAKTIDICLAAIRQNYKALRYVDNTTAKYICDHLPNNLKKIGDKAWEE